MSTLLEAILSIKRGRKNLPTCPKCGGLLRRSRNSLEGSILPARHLCSKCGYYGFAVVEQTGEQEGLS